MEYLSETKSGSTIYWKVCTKQPNLRIALRRIGINDNDPEFHKICCDAFRDFPKYKYIYIIKTENGYLCSAKKIGTKVNNYLNVDDKDIENDFFILLKNQLKHFFED